MRKVLLISLLLLSCSDNQNTLKNKKKIEVKENIDNNVQKLNEIAKIVKEDDLATIKQNINSKNVNISDESKWMFLPLYIAISRGEEDIVNFLLSIKGIDVNSKVEGDRKSLLIIAIQYLKNEDTPNRLKIVKFLVDNGAGVYYPEEKNEFMQPLYHAFSAEIGGVYQVNFEVLEILLNRPIELLKNDSEIEIINKLMDLIEKRYSYNFINNLIAELNYQEKERLDKIVISFLDKFPKNSKIANKIKNRVVFYQRAALLKYLVDNRIPISSEVVQVLENGFKFQNYYQEEFKEPLKEFLKKVKENNLIIN